MKLLSVVSELFPLIKTGGLADVAGALPAALAREGIEVVTLVPGYPAVMAAIENVAPVYWMDELFGGPATILSAEAAGLQLFVIEAKHLYDRPGGPYTAPDGSDWPDNAQRFAALARVAAQIAYGEVAGFVPDVLHAHDWQAGLVPAFLRYDGRRDAPSVMTVHNLAFQGQFPASLLPQLGLPPHAFQMDGVEYYGMIGFLKAGLALADRITTVSPTYATEIRTEEHGMGLAGLLTMRGSDLVGILNGIDDTVWDPEADHHLVQPFSAATLDLRSANKAALQRRFGLEEREDALLFGVVSRLSWQKGLDLLVEALPHLLMSGAQLMLVGAGDRAIRDAIAGAAAANPDRIAAFFGYDEDLAHQLQAGSDVLIVPSRFEPCGLTQLCALRYGALPLVSRVGGLADTVVDANEMARSSGAGTGFQFAPVTTHALEATITRAAELWQDQPAWRQLQLNAMATDVSWRAPAARYARLFREILAARATATIATPEQVPTPAPEIAAKLATVAANTPAITSETVAAAASVAVRAPEPDAERKIAAEPAALASSLPPEPIAVEVPASGLQPDGSVDGPITAAAAQTSILATAPAEIPPAQRPLALSAESPAATEPARQGLAGPPAISPSI